MHGWDAAVYKSGKGLTFLEELATFIRDRAKVEREYEKMLQKLNSKGSGAGDDEDGGGKKGLMKKHVIGGRESGTLRKAWDAAQSEMGVAIKVHATLHDSLLEDVVEPLLDYSKTAEVRRKEILRDGDDIVKAFEHHLAELTKSQSRYKKAVHAADDLDREKTKAKPEKRKGYNSKIAKAMSKAQDTEDDYKAKCDELCSASETFHRDDLPPVLKQLEEWERKRTTEIKRLLKVYTTAIREMPEPLQGGEARLATAIAAVDAGGDVADFVHDALQDVKEREQDAGPDSTRRICFDREPDMVALERNNK